MKLGDFAREACGTVAENFARVGDGFGDAVGRFVEYEGAVLDAQPFEGAAALVGIECAERFLSLAQHQVLFGVGHGGGIFVAFVGMRDCLVDELAARADRERM